MAARPVENKNCTYLVIKEFILKEIVQTAGEDSISLEFRECLPGDTAFFQTLAEEDSCPKAGDVVSYFPKGTVFPDKPDKFVCLVKGKKDPTRRALINQRGQTRFLSPPAAIALMRELGQDEARFFLARGRGEDWGAS